MLGLRVETDASIAQLRPAAHNKSTKFATSLRDRFHTTGVSGAMKHRPKATSSALHSSGVDSSQPAPRMRQLARDQHRASVEKELEEDERKLRELEEKLAEVRRLKAIKQEKKAERKRVRAQNKAAATIQRSWWRYKRQCASKCVDVIKSFLRTSANRQAITIGVWAVGVIKRFAIKASYVYLERQRLFAEAMKRVAEEEAAAMAARRAALEAEEAQRRMLLQQASEQHIGESSKKQRDNNEIQSPKKAVVEKSKSESLGADARSPMKAKAQTEGSVAGTPSREKVAEKGRLADSKSNKPSKANKYASTIKPPTKPALPDPASSISRRPPIPSASVANKVQPPPKKVVKEAIVMPTEPREARSITPRKALDAPKHEVEVKRRVQDELDEERLRRIAEMHQKRVEQMEIERLRRLKAVELKKQEIEAKLAKEREEKEREEEEKARKREEFMIKLDEAQHQQAREAEMVRVMKQKHQKEKEEELLREAAERKEMKNYDNFYNITSKILGGGEMSLQKRLSKPLHLNQPVVEEETKKRKPRVEAMSRPKKHVTDRVVKGSGTDVSSERSSSADPELMHRRSKELKDGAVEAEGSAHDASGGDLLGASTAVPSVVEDDSSLRLSYNTTKDRGNEASQSQAQETPAQIFQAKSAEKLLAAKKALEDEEAQQQARVLEDTRIWAQRRIAERKKAEKERQQALLFLEEERMKAHSTNLAAAREIAAKRIAEKAKEDSERKAKEEEKEEQRRKNQEMILEKAMKLLQKSKKREYALDKLNAKRRKKRNGISNAMTKLVAPEESIDVHDSVEGGDSMELDPSDSQIDETLKSLERNSFQDHERSAILSKNSANISESNGNDLVKKLKNVATIMSTINRLAPPSLAAFESPVMPGSIRSVAGLPRQDSFNVKSVLSAPTPKPPAPVHLRGPSVEVPSILSKELSAKSDVTFSGITTNRNLIGSEISSESDAVSDAKVIETLLPPDEKKKPGKVMELLEIVNRARKKLKAPIIEKNDGDAGGDIHQLSSHIKQPRDAGDFSNNKPKNSFVANMESQFRSAYGKPAKAKSKKHKELEAQTNRQLGGEFNAFPFLSEGGDGVGRSNSSGYQGAAASGFSHLFSGAPDLDLDPFVDIKNALPSSDGGIGGFNLSNHMGFDAPHARYRAQYTNEDSVDDNPFGFPDSMLKNSTVQDSLMSDPFETDPFSNWESQPSAPSEVPQAAVGAGDRNKGLPPRPSSKSTTQKPQSGGVQNKTPPVLQEPLKKDNVYEVEEEDDDRESAYESMLDAECDRLRELLEGKFLSLSHDFDSDIRDDEEGDYEEDYEQ